MRFLCRADTGIFQRGRIKIRLSVILNVTDSEREALLDGDEDTPLKVLKEHCFSVDENSYIRGCVAEEFRPDSDDVDFELLPTPIKYQGGAAI